MSSFEELVKKWESLISSGKYEEAEALYWSDLFSGVESRFLASNKTQSNCDWLVLPAGLEASYYILLIKALNPENVYFIGTLEFKQKFLNRIIEKTNLKPSQYIIDTLEYDKIDIAEVYEKIRARLDLFIGKKVIMDLTRGKRIMSVGAGIVGAFFGFDLVYINEEWNDNFKRGIPGTEKLSLAKNPFDVFGDLELKEARDFFSHYNYGAALALYKRIKLKIVDPRRVEVEELLSETYLHWNSFNFKAALSKLQQAINKAEQYSLPLPHNIKKNLIALEILTGGVPLKGKDIYNLHVMIDLYTNAIRKAEVGNFEDAITRLYRVIELMSQYRLSSYDIETSDPHIDKYKEHYSKITKEIYDFEKPLPTEIGLKDGYLLLYILNDFLVEGYSIEDIKSIFSIIRSRDMSIIAHGLQLAGEKVFVNMNDLAKSFIKAICNKHNIDFAELVSQHTFVKF